MNHDKSNSVVAFLMSIGWTKLVEKARKTNDKIRHQPFTVAETFLASLSELEAQAVEPKIGMLVADLVMLRSLNPDDYDLSAMPVLVTKARQIKPHLVIILIDDQNLKILDSIVDKVDQDNPIGITARMTSDEFLIQYQTEKTGTWFVNKVYGEIKSGRYCRQKYKEEQGES